MTTSSTPVWCFGPLLWSANRRAPPISGRLSIGLRWSDARLLAGVSTRITFTTVHADAKEDPAEIRRQRGQLQIACVSHAWTFRSSGAYLSLGPMNGLKAIRLPEAGSADLSSSLCHQVVKVGGPTTSSLRPRRARRRGDSHDGRIIGERPSANLLRL